MNRIILVVDLGRVRAFRLRRDDPGEDGRWHVSELEVAPLEEVPEKLSEVVSDQAGEFARGAVPGTPGGMSYGEEHHLKTELERRSIRGLAGRIGEIVDREDPESWDLAAPGPICKRLLAELDPGVRTRLRGVDRADLTKASLKEIEERYAPLGRP